MISRIEALLLICAFMVMVPASARAGVYLEYIGNPYTFSTYTGPSAPPQTAGGTVMTALFYLDIALPKDFTATLSASGSNYWYFRSGGAALANDLGETLSPDSIQLTDGEITAWNLKLTGSEGRVFTTVSDPSTGSANDSVQYWYDFSNYPAESGNFGDPGTWTVSDVRLPLPTPLPSGVTMFGSAFLGLMGLVGWRRKVIAVIPTSDRK